MSDTLDYEIVEENLDVLPTMEEQQVEATDPVDPGTLPEIRLSDETRLDIERYLADRISNMKTEREQIADLWRQIDELYEMTEIPEEEQTDFPFEDSAHLVQQIVATYTETVWAKLHGTIWAPSDPFFTEPRREEFLTIYKSLRRFITWACEQEIGLKKFTRSNFMEIVKLGLGCAKVVYEIEDREMRLYDPATRSYVRTTMRTKDHPTVIHVANEDLLYPMHTTDLEDATIIAHRTPLSYAEVKRRLRSRKFELSKDDGIRAAADLRGWLSTQRSTSEDEKDISIGVQSMDYDNLEFWEVWFEYALPGKEGDHDSRDDDDDDHEHTSSGLPVRLVASFNTDTGKLFKIQHNWYPLQLHPFEACQFIPRPNRIPGIGVGHMAYAGQKEISAMHNQRLDNATIANANVTFVKEDSLLPLNFQIRPGAVYRVADPSEVQIKPLGTKYDSTINEENHTLSMIERRIGAGDYQQNQPLTGTSTQAIINMQEATRKFDAVVDNVRDYLSRIMEKVLLLYQQHYPEGKAALILGTDGEYVEQLFRLSPKMIRQGIAVRVTATKSTTSKELERQAKLSLFNMITQYYGQLTQYVSQANNPQLPPPVQQTMLQIVEALGTLVGEILEDFNIAERDRLIVRMPTGAGAPPQQPTPFPLQQAAATGAANGGEGPAGLPRMADIQQFLAQQGGGGARGAVTG
jgi:hypothetical protein